MRLKQLYPGALAMITILTGAMSSCSKGEEQQAQQQQAPEVEVVSLETTSTDLSTSYPAVLKGKTDIQIRPLISGTIVKVHVEEGQHVNKGQLLFSLDPIPYEAAVNQARAAVASAQAALNSAQSQERNQKMLYDKGIISKTSWDTSVDNLNQARAGVAQAQAALVAAQKNLSYTKVTSPSNGVVGTLPYREGSLASPSSVEPLTTVSDINQVYADFSLTEKELLDLTDGGKYSLNERIGNMPEVQLILANGSVYPIPGKVSTVSGVIDSSTGAATVRALFDNTNGMLRSGSTGKIVIPRHQDNVLIIPQKATYELQDKRFALVVNDSNKAVARPITVLEITDGQNFVVLDGLKPGERIVTEGVGTKVNNGTPVKPKAPQAQQQAQQ
ncbi:MAG: efflux RND transporter periplasmic adaptor subunit [Muribaculaceae bacterium]|nr:efflux RND transporter periplasmic adaptor subunit [Muribaculaceae bacterium]